MSNQLAKTPSDLINVAETAAVGHTASVGQAGANLATHITSVAGMADNVGARTEMLGRADLEANSQAGESSAKLGLFDRLDEWERKSLLERCRTREFADGEVLFDIGDPGDSCFILTRGRVELSVRDHTGAKVLLAEVGAGDLFGELSLLDGEARTARATAGEASEALELHRDELLDFLRSRPDAALDLLAVLSGRIRRTNAQLQDRVARNVNQQVEQRLNLGQRVAAWITDFSGSILFLNLNILIFAGWIMLNTGVIPGLQPFDPYPFGFLTMAVSLEAIVLSICVLLAQNLQSERDRVRGDIEYDVNLKAELEVAHLHEKVDRLYSEVVKRLHSLEHVLRGRS